MQHGRRIVDSELVHLVPPDWIGKVVVVVELAKWWVVAMLMVVVVAVAVRLCHSARSVAHLDSAFSSAPRSSRTHYAR